MRSTWNSTRNAEHLYRHCRDCTCVLTVADVPDEVARDTGDMLAAKESGVEFPHKVVALGDIVAKRRAARGSPEDLVLYESVGSALQDVVIAKMLLRRARNSGLGTTLHVNISPVAK